MQGRYATLVLVVLSITHLRPGLRRDPAGCGNLLLAGADAGLRAGRLAVAPATCAAAGRRAAMADGGRADSHLQRRSGAGTAYRVRRDGPGLACGQTAHPHPR
ncbi:hypothetical protein G6F46_014836 [Rhizopus delemar]|nr:hypothetical protein G6F46_014836 [Rhizopus delemar]